jgi:hypothetical protein
MKTTLRAMVAAVVMVACFALPAYASASSWTKTTTHYNIYSDGGYATMYFNPPSTVPSSTLFSGLNAKGSFSIRHTRTGGSYTAVGNSITVKYTP